MFFLRYIQENGLLLGPDVPVAISCNPRTENVYYKLHSVLVT